jgi:hypothetical protein
MSEDQDHGPVTEPDAVDGTVAVEEPGVPHNTPEVTDAADGTGEPGDPSAPPSPGGRDWGRWLLLALPWVLVVLAVVAVVISTMQLQDLRAHEQTREDVERTAATFMLTLTTWDGTEGMSETRDELRAAGTDRFAGEVDELFGTTEDLAGLAEIGARSEGDVRRSYVQDVDDDRATALVVVLQRLSSDLAEEAEVSVRYAEVELLQHDGDWLVDEVELLVDAVQQEAGQVAPSTQPEQPGNGTGDDDAVADGAGDAEDEL